MYENIANSQNKTLNIVSFRNWRDSRSFPNSTELRRGGTPIGLILVFKEAICHSRLREGSGRGGCQRTLRDRFSARICHHVENASPKKSHSALWQPSRPGLPRNLEVANITRIFLFYVNSVPEPLLNAFTHIQKILLLSYEEKIKPKNVSRNTGQNNFWSFLQAWH